MKPSSPDRPPIDTTSPREVPKKMPAKPARRGRYMRMRVLFMISLKNLAYKKLRTFLTITGVVIGIGAIVFLVSLGLGLQQVVTERVIGSKSVNTIEVTSSKPQSIPLGADEVSRFVKYSHVTDIAKTFSFAGRISYQSSTSDAVIYGADTGYLDLSGFQLVAGKESTVKNDTDAIINTTLLKTIGIDDPNKALGQKIGTLIQRDKNQAVSFPLADDFKKELTIISVIDSGTSSEIFASDQLFSRAGFRDYSQLKIVVNDRANISQVRKQVEAQALTTSSPSDTLDQINQVFVLLNFLLAGFGGIGMVIAVLGMFNTLTITLLERTKEIGLLISLGARKKDIRRLFIVEAVVLSLSGALFGLVMAWLMGAGINTVAIGLASSRGVKDTFNIFFLPYWLILAVLLFATVVGLIVVAFPARRAVRISPVTALRRGD